MPFGATMDHHYFYLDQLTHPIHLVKLTGPISCEILQDSENHRRYRPYQPIQNPIFTMLRSLWVILNYTSMDIFNPINTSKIRRVILLI